MYDFHVHIIPNLIGDDGARTEEVSRRMLSQESEMGFEAAIAVSHLIPGEAYEPRESLLSKAAALSTGTFRLYAAHECYLTPHLPEIIRQRRAATLGGRYVLIELPMTGWIPDVHAHLKKIMDLGLTPVVSHPERCAGISEKPDRALELLHLGMFFQLNIGSLGDLSSASGRTAEWLLKHRCYHVAGTDAHSDGHRSPCLSKELKVLKTLVDDPYFSLLMQENAKRVIAGDGLRDCFDRIWEAEDVEVRPGACKIGRSLKKFLKRH